MIEFEDIHKLACSQFGMSFVGCSKFNGDFSVFKFPFKHQIAYLARVLHQQLSSPDIFIALYWMTMAIAGVGLFEACSEMRRVFKDEDYEPLTFGNRTYKYVSVRLRRQARICGQALNAKLYVGLLYGLAMRRTSYIMPWIVVYGIILPMEIFFWVVDVCKHRKWKSEPIQWLLVLVIRWALTLHMLVVIEMLRDIK
jgi:hypothetical protein